MESKIIKGQSSDKVAAGIAADPDFDRIQDLLRDPEAIDSAMSELDSFAMSLAHIDKLEADSDDDDILFGDSLGLPAAPSASGVAAGAPGDAEPGETDTSGPEAAQSSLTLEALESEDEPQDAAAAAEVESDAERTIEDLLQEAAAEGEDISDAEVEQLMGAEDLPAAGESQSPEMDEDIFLSPLGEADEAEDASVESAITFPDGDLEELDATAIMRNAVASGMAIAKPEGAGGSIGPEAGAPDDEIEDEAESWEAISDASSASVAAVDYRRALSVDTDEPTDLDEIDDAIEPHGLHVDDEADDDADLLGLQRTILSARRAQHVVVRRAVEPALDAAGAVLDAVAGGVRDSRLGHLDCEFEIAARPATEPAVAPRIRAELVAAEEQREPHLGHFQAAELDPARRLPLARARPAVTRR